MALTMDIKQLSKEINLAVKTIRTNLVRNPTSLPPRLIIQGQKKLIWLTVDVEAFYLCQLRDYGSKSIAKASTSIATDNKDSQIKTIEYKRRGRPTKRDQLEKHGTK